MKSWAGGGLYYAAKNSDLAQSKIVTRLPALFALYLALVGGNYLLYQMVLPVRIGYHLLITGALIWWLLSDGLPSTPLLYPLALSAVVTFVSAVQSADPRMALENWWHIFTNGLLMLMLISWIRRDWGQKLFKAHFAVGGVIALVSGLQALADPTARVGGPFYLISLNGAYAAALLVPVFVWAWTERRAWLYPIGVGLVGVLILNQSRGAFVSAGVAVVTFVLLRYRVRWHTLAIGIGVLILLAAGVMGMSLQAGHSAGDVLRLDIWRSALAMVKDHPLTGVGPGLFGQSFRVYGSVIDDRIPDAHNFILNTLAETGLAGALASGLSVWVFLRSIARKRTARQDAIIGALMGVSVHLLFDNFPITNFVFLINLYVAYLVAGREGKRLKPDLRTVAHAWAGTLLVVFGAFLISFDIAQGYYEQSLQTKSQEAARAAVTLDSANRLYQIQLARLEGNTTLVQTLDPTLSETTDKGLYGVVSFGRYWY